MSLKRTAKGHNSNWNYRKIFKNWIKSLSTRLILYLLLKQNYLHEKFNLFAMHAWTDAKYKLWFVTFPDFWTIGMCLIFLWDQNQDFSRWIFNLQTLCDIATFVHWWAGSFLCDGRDSPQTYCRKSDINQIYPYLTTFAHCCVSSARERYLVCKWIATNALCPANTALFHFLLRLGWLYRVRPQKTGLNFSLKFRTNAFTFQFGKSA